MRRALLGAALATASACIDFDTRLRECADGGGLCAADAGGTGGSGGNGGGGGTGGGGTGGGTAGGLPGAACFNGLCWVNPFPFGDDLRAITGTSESDVWVGGTAGFTAHWDGSRWDAFHIDGGLVADTLQRDVWSMVAFDGGVWAAGFELLPHRWNGTAWVAEPYAPSGFATISRDIWQLGAPGGQLVAVGDRSDALVALRDGAGTWREAAWRLGAGAVATAVSNEAGGTVAVLYGDSNGFTSNDGGLLSLDGGAYAALSGVRGGIYALWEEPAVGLWVAGDDCQLYLVQAADAGANICDTSSFGATFYGGGFVPGLGDVLVGNNNYVGVGGVNGFFRGTLEAPPDYVHNFRAVWAPPDGTAPVVVGEGGLVLRYQSVPLTWNAEALGTRVAVHAHVRGSAATDAGVVLATAGGGAALVVGTDLQVLRVAGAQPDDRAVWADDSTVFLARNSGDVCTMAPTGGGVTCTVLNPGGDLTGIAGADSSQLFVVGTGGAVFEADGGSWSQVSGPSVDYTAAAVAGPRRVAVSTNGSVYEYDAGAGGFAGAYSGARPLFGVTGLPTGEVFAVGDYDVLVRSLSDGGWAALEPSNARADSLYGVCAFSPSDVWAVGDNGLIRHWTGASWDYVESGTRTRFYTVACVTRGGQRSLVVGGDWGAVLTKPLP